jgi:hypothetical protein
MAHHVILRQGGISVAFGAKRTWLDCCWLDSVANDPKRTLGGGSSYTSLSSYHAVS